MGSEISQQFMRSPVPGIQGIERTMLFYNAIKSILLCGTLLLYAYRFNLEVQHCCAKIVRIFVSGKNNPIFF